MQELKLQELAASARSPESSLKWFEHRPVKVFLKKKKVNYTDIFHQKEKLSGKFLPRVTRRPQPGNAGGKLYPAQEAPRGSTELPSFLLLETPEFIFLYGLVNPLAHPQSIRARS